MNIHRAHSYDAVERVRSKIESLPDHWRAAIVPWKLILLPDDLLPSWVGLTLREEQPSEDGAWQGRTFDTVGGWCASEEHAYWLRDTPHIFLNHDSVDYVLHEVGHALARAWHADLTAFYRPERALHEYMGSDEEEFFACGLTAFLRPDADDKHWNRVDLAAAAPDLHDYFVSKMRANT